MSSNIRVNSYENFHFATLLNDISISVSLFESEIHWNIHQVSIFRSENRSTSVFRKIGPPANVIEMFDNKISLENFGTHLIS